MDQRQQRFRLGLFVLAATVLLAVLVLMFGGSAGRLFSRQTEYTVEFREAPGVTVGTPVRRSGVRIGTVTKVELNDATGNVVVRIAVEKGHTVWDTDEAVISQDLLSRDTTIDLVRRTPPTTSLPPPQPVPAAPKSDVRPVGAIEVPGDLLASGQPPLGKNPPVGPQPPPVPPAVAEPVPPGQPLAPGSTIPGRSPTGPGAALGQVQTILPAAEQALNAIRRSAERLEAAIPQLELGAREFTELGRSIREAVPEVRRTND